MNGVRALHNIAMAHSDLARCYEQAGQPGEALEYLRLAVANEQAAYDATPEDAEPTRTILRDSVASMRECVARLVKEAQE